MFQQMKIIYVMSLTEDIRNMHQRIQFLHSICTNDISRYNDRYELIPKFDKTYQIKVPFVSREKENMLLARALCEIQTGIHNDMECKIIARRLLMPKQEFLDQIKKNEDVSGRVNLTNIARHFCVDESVVSSLGVDLNLLSIF